MKKYNVGIALLRILMCFQVVVDHFYAFEDEGIIKSILDFYSSLAVPVFVILAFVYLDIDSICSDKDSFLKRMYRLVVPHIIWAFVYFVLYWLLDFVHGYSLGIHRGIKGLLSLIITGSALNPAAWFMVDLIIVTIMFAAIYRICGAKRGFAILLFLMVLSWALQYSGLWHSAINMLFTGTPFYWTVGRIIEVIPFAVGGLLIRKYNLMNYIQESQGIRRITIILVSIVCIVLLFCLRNYTEIENDFMYSGVPRAIKATFTIVVFGAMNFKPFGEKIESAIVKISKHTMAVFFMHNMIGTVLLKTAVFAKIMEAYRGTIFICVIIFAISMAIALIMYRIPSKTVKLVMS